MIKQTGILALVALLALALCSCQEAPKTDADTTAAAPASAAQPGAEPAVTLANATYNVEGMTCESCVAGISQTLAAVPGVRQCQVDLTNHCAKVEYDPAQVTDAKLIESINALGYTATLAAGAPDLNALAGEGGGCACGKEGGSGECSGECGDPAQSGQGAGCGGACENGAGQDHPTGEATLPEIPTGCLRQPFFVEGLATMENTDKLVAGINALSGVEGTYVDPAQMRIVVDFRGDTANVENIKSAITGFGLKLLDRPPTRGKAPQAPPAENQDA